MNKECKMATVQKPEKEVSELRDKLVKTLQDYCRSQVDLWRQVPGLARGADRSNGFTSGRYQMAYLSGYWPIYKQDIHGLWVELQTGNLGRDQLLDEIELGKLESILEALDASKVIDLLKSEIWEDQVGLE